MTGGAIANTSGAAGRYQWLNKKLLIGGLILAVAVGYLIFTAMRGNAAEYFVTVGELNQHAAQVDGKQVRVGGDVVPGTIHKGGPGGAITFEVTDGTLTMPVVYHGVLPDIFSDNVQVVVEGTYHQNGAFQADTLLTKCPSRFEATQTTQSTQ